MRIETKVTTKQENSKGCSSDTLQRGWTRLTISLSRNRPSSFQVARSLHSQHPDNPLCTTRAIRQTVDGATAHAPRPSGASQRFAYRELTEQVITVIPQTSLASFLCPENCLWIPGFLVAVAARVPKLSLDSRISRRRRRQGA